MVTNPAQQYLQDCKTCHVVSKILQKSTDCIRNSRDVAISILLAQVSTKKGMAISLQMLVCSGSSCTLGNGSASKPHKPRARGCGCCRFWVPLLKAFLSGSVFYAKKTVSLQTANIISVEKAPLLFLQTIFCRLINIHSRTQKIIF